MPQRRSAKKYLRQNEKRHQDNLRTKQKVKTAVKKLKKSLDTDDKGQKQNALKEVYKTLDKAAAKNVIHKNKASRKKSRLAKLLKSK